VNRIVAVDELARAYRAAAEGQFRTGRRRIEQTTDGGAAWLRTAAEHVVAVVACHGGAGASVVALGLAEAARDARVLECCTAAASGLVAASVAELGVTEDGWARGSRGSVLIERQSGRIGSALNCPPPSRGDPLFTVVDCGWDVDMLASDVGWLGDLVQSQPAVVVVARPTAPGLRRLESAVDLLGPGRVVAVLVGVEKRWPRRVERALGPRGRALRAAGRLICLPQDPGLAFNGITPGPLPASIVTGCSALLTLLEGSLR
jgi:hypothetical protein